MEQLTVVHFVKRLVSVKEAKINWQTPGTIVLNYTFQ